MLSWGAPRAGLDEARDSAAPMSSLSEGPGTQGNRCSPGSAEEMDQGLVC